MVIIDYNILHFFRFLKIITFEKILIDAIIWRRNETCKQKGFQAVSLILEADQ